MKVLVTCPPMLGMIDTFLPGLHARGLEVVAAEVSQQLSEEELLKAVPEVEGWIIGDDPATRAVRCFADAAVEGGFHFIVIGDAAGPAALELPGCDG